MRSPSTPNPYSDPADDVVPAAHDGLGEDDAELLGVLEDDRLRAVVTTAGDRTVVTLEGELDDAVAPVVDELLDAVGRYHTRAARRAGRGPVGRGGDRSPTGADRRMLLLLDTRRVEHADSQGLGVLDRHRQRWLRERGPCVTWRAAAGQ